MAIVNQFTKDKRWQRLQTLDESISKMRRQCRELYLERLRLVGEIYGDADHCARSGTSKRRVRDR
jgi:hypothetical protein